MSCCTGAFTVLMLLSVACSSSADNTDPNSTAPEAYCPDLKPQSSLDTDQIMGKWYVVEVVKHKVDAFHPTIGGKYEIDTCPVVQLRSINRVTIGLLWTEKMGNLDYSFNIPDLHRGPGFWISKDSQNGTLVTKKYVQFVGTVQVMKAVKTHMVLTFCYKTPDNQLYSMLLAREHRLPQSDAKGVRDLLFRRGLTIASVQKSCVNAGSRKEGSDVTRWMTVIVAALATATLAGTQTGFRV